MKENTVLSLNWLNGAPCAQAVSPTTSSGDRQAASAGTVEGTGLHGVFDRWLAEVVRERMRGRGLR